MFCDEIEYADVSLHIPHIMQTLYDEQILSSTSLVELRDAFRVNQMQCKAWLLQQLHGVSHDSRILVVGSWIGFTSYCLFKLGYERITEVDPDVRLEEFAKRVNSLNPRFCHFSCDVNDLDMKLYDVVINTSCEHISDNRWFDAIKPGTIVVLQSTNIKWHDHVNVANSVEHFKTQYPLKYTYADELKLNETCSRYMIIGEKL